MCFPHHKPARPALASFFIRRRAFAGFSLVEVVLALGILTFTITALLGAFAVGMRADRESVMELEATHIMQTAIAARRVRPIDVDNNLLLPPLNTAATDPASHRDSNNPAFVDKLGKVVAGARSAEFGVVYRVTPTAKTNGATNFADVYCAIYWPGQGAPANADGRAELATRIPLPTPTPVP